MKIASMTGSRADFSRVKSVFNEINHRENMELKLIVTGSHLLKKFGFSYKEILNNGFKIDYWVNMYPNNDDTPYGMAKASIMCANGILEALKEIQPDLFILTVDRVETLAAAQIAALMNIPIAHIQGGEITGTIDESIRHAVTKLSHIHFTSTIDAKERIIKMGEKPNHVYAVGCPFIDVINSTKYESKENLAKKYGFNPNKPLILFIQHPVTTEYGYETKQISITIEALKKFPDSEIITIYSNADAGGREIINKINNNNQFHIFPNIKSEDFISLMNCASVMIGNSSSGIREASSFHLPVINIGSRQNGRLRTKNVIDVPYNVKDICNALKKVFYDKTFKESIKNIINPYGDGFSAKRIVDILEKTDFKSIIQKRIAY